MRHRLQVGADGKLRVPPYVVHQAAGQVPGYGSVNVSVVFLPTFARTSVTPLKVRFFFFFCVTLSGG